MDRNNIIAYMRPELFLKDLKVDDFDPVVDIPDGQSGNMRVRHITIPAGKQVPMLAGGVVVPDKDLSVCQLVEVDEEGRETLWMSNTPSEVADMANLADISKGEHILIAGLGLGLLTTLVARKHKYVTVIEKSFDVIRLVQPYLPKNVVIIQTDFKYWADQNDLTKYDAVLLDIWGHISLDDLPEMVNLFESTGLHGGVWGIDVLIDQLCDEIRGDYASYDTEDRLRDEFNLPAIALKVGSWDMESCDRCGGEGCDDTEDDCDGSWADYSDDAIWEAFQDAYPKLRTS